MVTIVKHEWHQHDRQYAIELDEALLSEIYPDLDEDEIAEKLKQIEDGEIDVEDVINEAWENDVEIEWDFQYDDCWTDRKGGYDVTYELGDEDSWVEPDREPEPTHECTHCRWKGAMYETLTQYLREDGTVIEDYHSSDEESHDTKDVCPMCDSAVKLTEHGEQQKIERDARMAEFDAMFEDDDSEDEVEETDEEADERIRAELEELKREFDSLMTDIEEEPVPCFSCGEPHMESELPEMSGQYICPSCGEGWVMSDARDDNDQ
jgi:ribosomal protein S27AE